MGTKLRVLIVDDESLARQVLREYLSRTPDIEILGEAANGFDAVKMIAELKPDLVFLDIQMPKLDGFEVLELSERRHGVVFVTAYDQFALKAFEVHALDYLLKPFSEERLQETIVRARKTLGETMPVEKLIAAEERKPLTRIVIRDGTNIHVIPVETIDSVEAQDDYAEIVAGGKKFLKHQTISEFETLLPPERFVRVHRSFLINVDRISRIEPFSKDSRVAILKDGRRIPISRTGYLKLKDRM